MRLTIRILQKIFNLFILAPCMKTDINLNAPFSKYRRSKHFFKLIKKSFFSCRVLVYRHPFSIFPPYSSFQNRGMLFKNYCFTQANNYTLNCTTARLRTVATMVKYRSRTLARRFLAAVDAVQRGCTYLLASAHNRIPCSTLSDRLARIRTIKKSEHTEIAWAVRSLSQIRKKTSMSICSVMLTEEAAINSNHGNAKRNAEKNHKEFLHERSVRYEKHNSTAASRLRVLSAQSGIIFLVWLKGSLRRSSSQCVRLKRE